MSLPNNLPQRDYIQGFWQFEDNFNDSSDNGNDLTETSGTIPFVSGKIGKAADFERDDTEYLMITDANQNGLDITGEITICAWINTESFPGSGAFGSIAAKHDTGANKRAYRLAVDENRKVSGQLSNNGTATVTAVSTTAMNTGTFYHVCFTLNQTTDVIQCYINGSADGSTASFTTDIYDNDIAFTIGCNMSSGSPGQYFDGLIDEVIVWNTALTSGEISDLYNISAYTYGKAGFFAFFCESWQRRGKLWRNNKLILPKDLGFSY